jgi:hypothetical protein
MRARSAITRRAARHVPGFFVAPSSIIIAGRDDEDSQRHVLDAVAG